ncbi:MAG: hypothetical protein ACK55I_47420, partial [bacterium]
GGEVARLELRVDRVAERSANAAAGRGEGVDGRRRKPGRTERAVDRRRGGFGGDSGDGTAHAGVDIQTSDLQRTALGVDRGWIAGRRSLGLASLARDAQRELVGERCAVERQCERTRRERESLAGGIRQFEDDRAEGPAEGGA